MTEIDQGTQLKLQQLTGHMESVASVAMSGHPTTSIERIKLCPSCVWAGQEKEVTLRVKQVDVN